MQCLSRCESGGPEKIARELTDDREELVEVVEPRLVPR